MLGTLQVCQSIRISAFRLVGLEKEKIWKKEKFIKRVIALPGEHVKIENGKVYINGTELEEPYLQPNVVTTVDAKNYNYFSEFTVPEGYVFAMGDNRSQSTDCRAFGCVPVEKVESKVWIRFWPLNLFGKV